MFGQICLFPPLGSVSIWPFPPFISVHPDLVCAHNNGVGGCPGMKLQHVKDQCFFCDVLCMPTVFLPTPGPLSPPPAREVGCPPEPFFAVLWGLLFWAQPHPLSCSKSVVVVVIDGFHISRYALYKKQKTPLIISRFFWALPSQSKSRIPSF